jgi:Ni/Fe-hydrogenase subunit HybB-like protein
MAKEAKKEESHKSDNSFGIASVVLGILSIIFASANGIILAIIALVFASKQQKKYANSWSRAGKILSIIGIILSILAIIISVYYLKNYANLGGMYGLQ